MVNLKADMILEKGLSSNTMHEIDDLGTAYEKWTYLKDQFLRATNSESYVIFNLSHRGSYCVTPVILS